MTSCAKKLTPVALPPRPGEAGDQTKLDWAIRDTENDRDRRGRCFSRDRAIGETGRRDYRYATTYQLGNQCRQPTIVLASHPVILDAHILAFKVTRFTQSLAEIRLALRGALSAVAPLMKPTTGIAGCCARAVGGHAAAAPPSSVMNSRRFTAQYLPCAWTKG